MTVTRERQVIAAQGRLAGLEGLRGIAALGVLVGHAGPRFGPASGGGIVGEAFDYGRMGLVLFFALSGFLLYRPFAAAIMGDRPAPDIRRYTRSRFFRIWPGYLAIFALVAWVFGVASLGAEQQGGKFGAQPFGYMTDPGMIVANLFMAQTLFPDTLRTGISVAWSLTVELVFYIVMPIIAVAVLSVRRGRPGTVGGALIAPALLLVIGFAGKSWFHLVTEPANAAEAQAMAWGANWTSVLARSFLYHADLFAWGMVAAVICNLIAAGRISAVAGARLRWIGLAVGVAAVLVGRIVDTTDSGIAVLAAALVLFVAAPRSDGGVPRVARTLETWPFVQAGLISYSVYLWHMPVIAFLERAGFPRQEGLAGWLGMVALVFAITVGLSFATYHLVEKPAMRFGKARTPRVADPAVSRGPAA
ncbi:acyltransferase family protein [Microbacterium lacusdiani]